jgi:hypothetical protein
LVGGYDMKNIQRKIGTVNFGNYFERIVWLKKSTWRGQYTIEFSVDKLPDKFSESIHTPKIKINSKEFSFNNYMMGGGFRYRRYCNIGLEVKNIEEIIEITDYLRTNPKIGFMDFRIGNIDHVVNEIRIEAL